MQINSSLIIVSFLFLISCKNSNEHKWSELPEVTDIRKLKQTDFVPSLENLVDNNKNIIYAPAFLFAWDKMKEKLNAPIILSDSNSIEFRFLNQSSSHKNSLKPDEYSVEVEMLDSMIIAKAFFNKTVPFPSPLQKMSNPILFGETQVSAFGMNTYDEEVSKFTEILYYKNDDHFIIKLNPEDTEHEIILAKGVPQLESLAESLNMINSLITSGKIDKNNPRSSWKYILNDVDIFSIPTIQFNIEKYYGDIEGQVFKTNGKKHYIETAYQRTGFILNEYGAVVESEALALKDSTSSDPIRIQPKKLIFNNPFFIIIKRVATDNPYFVMYVRNSELLMKHIQH